MSRLPWHSWNPGLDNDHLTMAEVLETLPAAPPNAIPWQIKLLENPGSRFALPGAINLHRHDAIHVLLGRGLRNQDEAFVIGFTMGATKDRLKRLHIKLFELAARYFYPKPYTFTADDLIAYRLGVAKGIESGAENLEHFPFERFLDLTVAELRKRLGISRHKLYAVYREERILLPDKKASGRLDYDWLGADPSAMARPEGEDAPKGKKERG